MDAMWRMWQWMTYVFTKKTDISDVPIVFQIKINLDYLFPESSLNKFCTIMMANQVFVQNYSAQSNVTVEHDHSSASFSRIKC